MDYKVKLQLGNRATTWLERIYFRKQKHLKVLIISTPLPCPLPSKKRREKERKITCKFAIHISKQICMVFPSRVIFAQLY